MGSILLLLAWDWLWLPGRSPQATVPSSGSISPHQLAFSGLRTIRQPSKSMACPVQGHLPLSGTAKHFPGTGHGNPLPRGPWAEKRVTLRPWSCVKEGRPEQVHPGLS